MFRLSITLRQFFVASIIICAGGPALCIEINPLWPVSAQEDRANTSAFGSPTTPASSYQNNIIRNPQNLYGAYGNSIVTGNIGGGRHFRGVVPYGSATEFSDLMSDEGSTSMYSFMRRSAGSPYFGGDFSSGARYYQPERTVTSLMRGNSSGLTQPELTFQGNIGYTAPSLTAIEKGINYRTEPLPFIAAEIEKKIAAEQLLRQRILDLDKSLLKDDYLTDDIVDREKLANKLLKIPDSLQPLTPEKMREILLQEKEKQQSERVDEYLKSLEDEEQRDKAKQEEGSEEVEGQTDEAEKTVFDNMNIYAPKLPDSLMPKVDPEEAAGIRGEHKTFASLAMARYKEYMAEGDQYMREGKYYRAADSYTLASVWEERDATAYAKRSYALFAAGDYMSSSYWLMKAITLSKEYASRKVDLTRIIGDRDVLENRIIEISKWLQLSKSGETAFLLAYVLYQDGKAAEAKEAIDTAYERMPENEAVVLLKKAIEGGGR